jgi:hypothetical protein
VFPGFHSPTQEYLFAGLPLPVADKYIVEKSSVISIAEEGKLA